MQKIKFTRGGYADLKKEYDGLILNRVKAVSELQRAREMGDLSENAAYRVARSALSRIDSRIRRIDKILRSAVVVDPPKDGYIDLGSRVTLEEDDGQEKTVYLVDGYESDIMRGKISVYSPIGKALRGKRKGDKIIVTTPKGKVIFTINDVS
ncbi:hypothetical protein A2334_03365 [Candidatus Roizmanbacteria bacterium RIFOXYB2_FULL_38_10]|uniref:Transcription elongation factor GreA n=1 Tax=Candidatus Roizmanbacteria bacterium RIFOXYD1_FULL_38_12 TaxID=1802093 RepID=A0A1F7L115_9BACT|nr:MAG: hypothetical protein A3K47_03480 [Candidatus Roizmanbacteria bacterium RIFOXYA2_FULL_38_14]OGK63824.1 MAG: hypothetical protein A3K27_03480 [Candidatus Roizmanbacteria bacterium RIFOXYA1_FULL_37_12]OGK65670.1 MAG: hypothetical protein A3K38_03480 [Candidatus Roizmanbacteria bacterium RIFOXYB1_FULL_40_23]OGK67442.1 MAG: hypothetical protein A2334_03365 [Candidatus Roizmanbacteria bacterium RIFOXYB2_FULL_38_10]OGK70075.1 MAG: hypothetical protein A3K21_03485 [Candidatus Roizmanbacteria ba